VQQAIEHGRRQGLIAGEGSGPLQVLDDEHIVFADIRSPATVANLARNPAIKINFVDPFSRKGYRFRGSARIVGKGSAEFTALLGRYSSSSLSNRYRAFVVLKVASAAPLVSPAYDVGSTEPELRRQFRAYFDSIQPKS
jgi:predicted pyridoxine 5'-phosphate oxidase superfamily flavin-nucleotide-binding protein